eukprot:7796295-Pyramimonas_sp.AAC.1
MSAAHHGPPRTWDRCAWEQCAAQERGEMIRDDIEDDGLSFPSPTIPLSSPSSRSPTWREDNRASRIAAWTGDAPVSGATARGREDLRTRFANL